MTHKVSTFTKASLLRFYSVGLKSSSDIFTFPKFLSWAYKAELQRSSQVPSFISGNLKTLI